MSPEYHQTNEQEGRDFLVPKGEHFSRKANTLILGVDQSDVDLSGLQELAGQASLAPKSEFHITVLGSRNGREINKALTGLAKAESQQALSKILTLVRKTDWRFTLEPEKFHITKEYPAPNPDKSLERREAFIQMVSLPNLETFYDQLNSILGTNLEPPPAHITLYTGSSNPKEVQSGIGINSQAELEQLNPEPIQ